MDSLHTSHVQAHLAIEAYIRLHETVANAATRQRREVWAYVQSALSHAAMISKYMDPPKKSPLSKARAKALKEVLVVDETSPVFSRNARNNVEHLDERLDLWMGAGEKPFLEYVFDSRKDYDYLNPPEAGLTLRSEYARCTAPGSSRVEIAFALCGFRVWEAYLAQKCSGW